MSFPCVYLTFHNDLQMLLQKSHEGKVVEYALKRRASLKDIIESQGIPHTEVAQILLNNMELGFGFIPVGGETIDILPFSEKISVFTMTLLRPQPIYSLQFMVDINVRKLARNLRIIGFDTTLVPDMRLVEIGNVATSQQRILITRNRELLKCNTVIHGHLVRSENHVTQLQEAAKLYKLKLHIKPFSRCIACNGDLVSVAKQDIFHRLEPLTQKYFNMFKRCNDCEKIYWQGSHHEQMLRLISEVC
jgi:uncharacterized protein